MLIKIEYEFDAGKKELFATLQFNLLSDWKMVKKIIENYIKSLPPKTKTKI